MKKICILQLLNDYITGDMFFLIFLTCMGNTLSLIGEIFYSGNMMRTFCTIFLYRYYKQPGMIVSQYLLQYLLEICRYVWQLLFIFLVAYAVACLVRSL